MEKGKEKTYYILPLDSYNQPDGNIREIQLTKSEYETLRSKGQYIYESYYQAVMRAQD
jgi:hypothetical protein